MKRLTVILFASLLFGGCVYVDVSRELSLVPGEQGRPILATVEIANSGWFLLDTFPIVCGDPSDPGGFFASRFFRNTLTSQSNVDILSDLLEKENASAIGNLTTHETDEGILVFLLTRRVFRTSATLLGPLPETEGK